MINFNKQRPTLFQAEAQVKGSPLYPNIKGKVTFKQTVRGVLVTAEIEGLPTSNENCNDKVFGLHIHSGKSCSGNREDYFANVDVHYNPNNCPHPSHAGDLPPLFENNGYAFLSVLTNRFRLKDIIGKTIVIHDKADDFTSQPSGNSGNKIACGEIKLT